MKILKKILRISKLYLQCRGKKTWAINIAKWKRPHFEKFINEDVLYIPMNTSWPVLRKMAIISRPKKLYIWGCLEPESVKKLMADRALDVVRVEDGFVRSVGLGAEQTPPLSLCFDTQGIYFDSTKPSDLESLLNNYDFSDDESGVAGAKKLLNRMIEFDITKYNEKKTSIADQVYGRKNRKRILVIGQVEDDQSIKYGCERSINNNDLVRLAAEENPESQIIYKIHPDVLIGKRAGLSDPTEVKHLCTVVSERMSLSDALTDVDHVYTITSLLGFEALLRGVPVTTVGCPFYSGWGLTDDRQLNKRRKRSLKLEEVFYVSYMIYPSYRDVQGNNNKLSDVIELIKSKT